jgi:phage terminase small subunit
MACAAVLTPKQRRFVAEYLKDLNATQAAIRAGYSEKTAKVQASRLLTKANVASAVAAGTSKQLETAELSAVRVLEEMRRLAFVDMRSFFDEAGNLIPVSQLTPEQGSALASFEVIKKNAAAGDGVIDTVHKFKVWDKTRSLEQLAKHFGLLTEKIEHSGGLAVKWLE